MKNHQPLDSLFRAAALLSIFGCFTNLAPADTSDTPKTHVLFMGADFAVELGGKTCPVRQVSGSYWVVEKDGTEMRIPTRSGNLTLKIAPSLKLTENTAKLAEYSVTVGYSPKNDPSSRLTRALDDAAAANIGRETAVTQGEISQMHWASLFQSVSRAFEAANGAAISPGADLSRTFSGELAAANAGDVSNGEPTAEINTTGKDAVDVTFAATTDHEIDDAYIVTVARFRARGDRPGVYRNLIYAKDIGTIDANRRMISVNESGFPPRFELLDFQLHVYHAGQELATNISSRRVDLTREEAFEYVKTEYVGANGGKTVSAEPAMGHLPADFPAKLAKGGFRSTYYVRIGSNGCPVDVFDDRECSRREADPYIDSLVMNLRFLPALSKGTPVESVAPVHLDQLKI
jgi:hypothetical protein